MKTIEQCANYGGNNASAEYILYLCWMTFLMGVGVGNEKESPENLERMMEFFVRITDQLLIDPKMPREFPGQYYSLQLRKNKN